jgi:hypothetical protein
MRSTTCSRTTSTEGGGQQGIDAGASENIRVHTIMAFSKSS